MPKTIICSICGNEVTKRSTYAIGDGKRACRHHEGVDEQAQRAQADLKVQQQAIADKWKKKRTWRSSELPAFDPSPKCFCCKTPGMRQQEFFLQMLVAGERYEMETGQPLNPFDPEANKKAYSHLKGTVCLWYVAYDPDKMRLPYHSRMAAQIIGVTLLCQKCCDKFGIDPNPVKPDTGLEDLAKIGAVYEVLFRPTVREIAKEQLERANADIRTREGATGDHRPVE